MRSPTLSLRMLAAFAALALTNLQAQDQFYQATLNGPSESPPNASPGTGFASITYNPTLHVLRIVLTFSGLLGTTLASHIHAATTMPFTGTAGVATTTPTFAGFPLGVTSGTYDSGLLDLTSATSYNPAYITANGGTTAGAEAALVLAMHAGEAYVNIHTTAVAAGEIRGFIIPVAAPETGTTLGLMMLALGGLIPASRRMRRA